MSSTVDERIVQMKFDNSQFEENATKTIATLDKLDKGLNFGSTDSGLLNLQGVVNKFNFMSMENGLQSLTNKFTALDVVAATIINRLTNKVVDAGAKMGKALTIEGALDGFNEYELKMNSVQTILNSAVDKTGKSVGLEQVKEKLEELNIYADKTIYSFKDMTDNIGKFTNAGVDLDTAVKAIQGISNEAALSGANAEQASHAMYNFAQALSTGYIQTIDWKSIEVAQMATKGFKEELLKTADEMGTVEKQSNGMYKVLTHGGKKFDEEISATKKFRDSLQSQWLTTEVLTKTLEKYSNENTEVGKKAFKAAQDIKTFTQLIDVLKESIGSGWAQSFEYIIGDFKQAKKLWSDVGSVLSGITDRQAKARNALLKGWEEDGGRRAAIKAIKNIWLALSDITTKASEAMDHVFPDVTVDKIVAVTKSFKDFTKNLRLNDEVSHNLYETFKGVFSIVDIGVQFFRLLGNAISPIIGLVPKAASSFLGFTGKIGGFLDKVDKALKKSDSFSDVLHNLNINVLDNVPSFEKLKDRVSELGDKLEPLKKKFKDLFGKFTDKDGKRIDFLGLALKGFYKAGELGAKGIDFIFKAFGKFKEGLSKLGLSDILEGLQLYISINTFRKIIKFFGGFGDIFESVGDIFDDVKKIPKMFTDIGDSISDFIKKLNHIKTLEAISKSLLILSGALLVLSLIPSDKLESAVGGISIVLGEIVAAMTLLDKLGGKKKGFVDTVGSTMIKLSASILILALALKSLSGLDIGQLQIGLSGITVLLLELAFVAALLSKDDGKIKKGGTTLIMFALALKIMGSVVKSLSEMNMDQLGTGLAGVGVMLTYLIMFSAILGKLDSVKFSSGLGLIEMAASLLILYQALESFSKLDMTALSNGIIGMTAVLAVIGIFSALMQGNKVNLFAIGTGMLVMSAAMLVLSSALSSLGSIPLSNIGVGLTAIAGALIIFGITGALLSEVSVQLLGVSTAFLIFAVGVNAIVPALQALSQLSVADMITALVGLGGAMLIFGVASLALADLALPIIGVSIALGIFAVSINLLIPALQALSSMGVENLIVSLGGLAGVLIIFGVAATLLSATIIPMMGLAVALTLLGASCIVLGAGLTVLTYGLQAFGGMVVSVFSGVGTFLSDVFGKIGGIGGTLLDLLGKAKDGILNLFKSGETTEEANKAVDETANAITNNTSKVTQATDGLVQGAQQSMSALPDAYGGIGVTSIEAFTNGLGSMDFGAVTDQIAQETTGGLDFTESLNSLGIENMTSYASGIDASSGDVTDAISTLGGAVDESFAGLTTDFYNQGSSSVGQLSSGITDNKDKVNTAGKKAANSGVKGVKSKNDDYYNAGMSADQGLANGMKDYTWIVDAAAKHVANSAVNTAKATIQSRSPSKVFERLGMYSDQGFANGFLKFANLVSNAAGSVAGDSLSTVKDTMARVYSIANEGTFMSPTITPVMDLSEIQNGANSIPGMLSGYSLSLANTNNAMNNEQMARNQANNLASLFGGLKNAIMNQQPSNNYNINGVTYDDGSNIANAMQAIANAAIIEGRM